MPGKEGMALNAAELGADVIQPVEGRMIDDGAMEKGMTAKVKLAIQKAAPGAKVE